MLPKVKVLITDDSVVYRTQIRSALSHFEWLEVVGAASNGRLALEQLRLVSIDLLILDLEMPEVDGIKVLTEISAKGYPVKTLVFSSASKRGADITLEALRLGAKDFVTKPGSAGDSTVEQVGAHPGERIRALLEPKLRALFPEHFSDIVDYQDTVSRNTPMAKKSYPTLHWESFYPSVVVIGSSTGGPNALETILSQLGTIPSIPILIAQHMPPIFTASLAERITKLSGIPTKEAVHGEILKANCIYIAPGDFHMTLVGTPENPRIKLDQTERVNSVRPAVDNLFISASSVFKNKCFGIVLTGMGADGKVGAEAIKDNGGAVAIQNKETCIVFGMPGAVFESGAFDKMLPLNEITVLLREKSSSNIFSNLKKSANGGI